MIINSVKIVVERILEGYISYIDTFNELTSMSPKYFKDRDWLAMQQNNKRRLRLYKDQVSATRLLLSETLKNKLLNQNFWGESKAYYSWIITERKDKELAETFFNSVLRKISPQSGIDPNLMYVHEGYDTCDLHTNENLYHSYPSSWGLQKIIRKIIEDFDFDTQYFNKEEDIQLLLT